MSENISRIQVIEAISKLNAHFNIHLPADEFKSAEYSSSSIKDILIQKVMDEVSGEWTAEIAFRKIKAATAKINSINADSIILDTPLEELFPAANRKEKMQALSTELGFSLEVLKPNSKIYGTLIFLFFACIPFAIGMDWFVSGITMVVILILIYILGKTGNNFKMKTIGQMADVVAWKNYLQQQKGNSSYSEEEIRKKVGEVF